MKRYLCCASFAWFFLSINLSATTPVPLTMTYNITGELCPVTLMIEDSKDKAASEIILTFGEDNNDLMTFALQEINADNCGCKTYKALTEGPEGRYPIHLTFMDRSACSCKNELHPSKRLYSSRYRWSFLLHRSECPSTAGQFLPRGATK